MFSCPDFVAGQGSYLYIPNRLIGITPGKDMKPAVVIVGRPNVGKSTLFNRITRTRDALVDDTPGVTRDRKYGDASWNGMNFIVVDTGGFMSGDEDRFSEKIHSQVRRAVAEADALVLVLDGRTGLSPFDTELMEFTRDVSCPVFYVVNKIDAPEREADMAEFYTLGLEKLYPVSAAHGYGVGSFLDDLVEMLPRCEEDESFPDTVRIAVVGRPNVGKSTFVNRVLGEERMIVSDVPGTTRDSLDSLCEINGRSYLLVDTAGLRRKGRVSHRLEKFSAVKTLRSLDRCDIALIMIDAVEGITDQDITIAGYAFDRGCGCIFLVNKWDLAKDMGARAESYYQSIRDSARFLNFAPVVIISAATGLRVKKTFDVADEVYSQYRFTIKTGELNNIIERAVRAKQPPLYRGRRLKFNYATQISSGPPTFVCFVNFPGGVHFSYHRYLVNAIRRETGLDKTPLRLFFREKTGRIDFGPKRRGPKRSKRR